MGETRSDHTGSVSMFSPDAWMSSEAWPTMVNRNASRSTRRSGLAGSSGSGHEAGHFARPPPNCHFNRSMKPRGASPPGLKKTPSLK